MTASSLPLGGLVFARKAGAVTEYSLPSGGVSTDVASAADGTLWFTEQNPPQIVTVSPSGTVAEHPLPPNSDPAAITLGPDGNLWVADDGQNKVLKVDPTTGNVLQDNFAIGAGAGLFDITTGPDNKVWFTEQSIDKVGRIDPTNSAVTETAVSASTGPGGITSGPDGNVWFTEGGAIGVMSTAATPVLLHQWQLPPASGGSLRDPINIVTGPDGNLWFAEFDGNSIGRITPAGLVREFPVPTLSSTPFDIVTGPDSNLWFSEEAGNAIARMTPDGSFTEFSIGPPSVAGTALAPGIASYTRMATAPRLNGSLQPGGSGGAKARPHLHRGRRAGTAATDPEGTTFDTAGNLWFAERDNTKVGKLVATQPAGITVGADSNLAGGSQVTQTTVVLPRPPDTGEGQAAMDPATSAWLLVLRLALGLGLLLALELVVSCRAD